MSSMMSMPFATRKQFPTSGDELFFDYRQRRALEEQERADLKVADQAQQCSALNSAPLAFGRGKKSIICVCPQTPSILYWARLRSRRNSRWGIYTMNSGFVPRSTHRSESDFFHSGHTASSGFAEPLANSHYFAVSGTL